MERTSLPGLAPPHARSGAAGGLQRLRQGLESLGLKRLASYWQETLAATIALVAAWQFSLLAFERHDNFQSNAYDLGFFDQIIWNTSRGRFFETSFVDYNFLGQHFDPILLAFAGIYALGGGVKTLLLIQAACVGVASLPLFLATRRLTGNALAGFACSGAFLLSVQLHTALSFDFHPETLAFFFVFLSLYFLSSMRPRAAVIAVLPLLLLKEDLAMVTLAMAVIIALRRHRRAGALLAAVSITWTVVIVFGVMPLLRQGEASDLALRYSYLFKGSSLLELMPVAIYRGAVHLSHNTLLPIGRILASGGIVGLLSPFTMLLTAPNLLISGLATHPQQSRLELHYSVPTLALVWVSVAFGLEQASRLLRGRALALSMVGTALLAIAALTFFVWSPYAPGRAQSNLDSQHRQALTEALALIPPEASLEAQSSILPHLSARRDVYEFPNDRVLEYVIVDARLPVTTQSRAAGFSDQLSALTDSGYQRIFAKHSVQVFRRSQ